MKKANTDSKKSRNLGEIFAVVAFAFTVLSAIVVATVHLKDSINERPTLEQMKPFIEQMRSDLSRDFDVRISEMKESNNKTLFELNTKIIKLQASLNQLRDKQGLPAIEIGIIEDSLRLESDRIVQSQSQSDSTLIQLLGQQRWAVFLDTTLSDTMTVTLNWSDASVSSIAEYRIYISSDVGSAWLSLSDVLTSASTYSWRIPAHAIVGSPMASDFSFTIGIVDTASGTEIDKVTLKAADIHRSNRTNYLEVAETRGHERILFYTLAISLIVFALLVYLFAHIKNRLAQREYIRKSKETNINS